jgi:LTXXQ motif family protein
MKNAFRCLLVSTIILSTAAFASIALARGGHRGPRGGSAVGGNLCTSAAMLNLSLTTIDIMIKPNGLQTAALEELKNIAKENSDSMAHVCAGDSPLSVPEKLATAEKRLEAALTGARRLKPFAEKFYATLNDEQKAQANGLLDWPGL